jgi:hypothetical protein
MGLIRGVARTAVIAGTATAVSNRVSRRQANRWAAQEEPQYEQQQYAAPAPAQSEGPDLAELQRLADMKEQGILTQAEFDVEKARILGH